MCCLHLSGLVLLLLVVDMTSSCTQMTVAWLLGCTCTPLSQHLWLSLEWNVSLSSTTWRSWRMLTRFSFPSVSRQGNNLVTVWHIFRLPFKMYWTDPNKFTSTLTTSWIDITLFLRTTSFTWSRFSCVSSLTDVPCVQHLPQTSNCFSTWKTIKKLVFFPLPTFQNLLSTFIQWL